jgi:hypothetical protein
MMFLSFIVLMSWHLTGVASHEWIGLALIALILTHLVVHWGWVEGTVSRLSRRGHRGGLIALILNTALLVSMGTALVSGVVISKVVFPNKLLPGDYLHWHGLHDGASTFTLFVLGLHVALNWDRIRSSVRRLFDKTRRGTRGVAQAWRLPSASLVRRFAWVLGVSVVVTIGVLAAAHAVPTHAQVLMTFPDGHTELTSPPGDIARLHPGSTAPDPQRGTPRLVLSLAMLSLAAVVGRRGLKLRLR